MNLDDLFKFYNDRVKLLYSSVQSEGYLPVEFLFELNAAFDHISRIYSFKEPEEYAVAKAYSHLKKSCLDIFKLKVKETLEQYKELNKIDTSIIDKGDFDFRLKKLIYEIKKGARDARYSEGSKSYDDNLKLVAFDLWENVYNNCVLFEKEFYNHESVDWAKKKGRTITFTFTITLKRILLSIFTIIVGAIIGYILNKYLFLLIF